MCKNAYMVSNTFEKNYTVFFRCGVSDSSFILKSVGNRTKIFLFKFDSIGFASRYSMVSDAKKT